jgi:serine/threonine protein kinase
VGSILPGNVRVLNRLGETPEGVLYRAEYSTGLKVALLLLHPLKNAREADAPLGLLRLQQQIQRAIQIQHVNVAAVYEIGKNGGSVYLLMEHLAGELLSDTLAARGQLQFDEALDLWRQTAAGLEAAHRVGLAHGNVSLRTILITKAGDRDRRVKLIRFPLLEQQSDLPIDAEYASPERRSGQTPAESDDVFSLGAVLHHLLTGSPPHGSPARSLPSGMRAVLTQALASAPARRFQTVSEFAAAVERAVAIPGRPKRTGANRSLVAIGTTLVVIMAGLGLSWSLRRGSVNGAGTAQETATGRVGLVEQDSASHPVSGRAANGRSPPRPRRARAAIEPSSNSTPPPIRTSKRVSSAPVGPKKEPLKSSVRRDSAPPPKLSSFRRLHPWAAVPGKRFYFGSSCPLALQATDLVYFKTEEEARADGFVPSRVPGCY